MKLSDEQFADFIGAALDSLPQDYVQPMLADVAVTYEDEPSQAQRDKQQLGPHETLLGLYEGSPRPYRDPHGFGQPRLPDKITLFKKPIIAACATQDEVKEQVRKTLWHEMAHYFGLNHDRIHQLE